MTLKALIFDVDGTLADTERDGHRVAFNRAFADAGLDWHWGESLYGKLLKVGGGRERLYYYISKWKPQLDPGTDPDEQVMELHSAKTRHYLQLMSSGLIPLRPGVERLLREARAEGVRLAIATTSSPASVNALLGVTLGERSAAWFDVVAAGDCVPRKKPAADVYLHALDQLGLDASECLALEDSDIGLRSAMGAGIETVVTVNGYTAKQDFTGAALVLNQLGEPGAGFEALAGDAGPATYVDIAFLRALSARRRSPSD